MANILIVDDDPGVRQALCRIVRMKEHTAFEAASGVEALEALRAQPIDMAFVDLNMPEMNGLELMILVRKEHPDTRLVPMSAVEDLSTVPNKFTAEGTLTKPFAVEEVGEVLSDAFDLRLL